MACVHELIVDARKRLTHSTSAKLDAELLLARTLQVDRAKFYAFPDMIVSDDLSQAFEKLLVRRIAGEPVAYLLGEQEFWSLSFKVTPEVLIPRPETELLVEWLLSNFSANESISVVDLGTGSGAIACTLAKERPNWQITATDQSEAALLVAKDNAKNLGVFDQVEFLCGSWFAPLQNRKFNVIVSNPPYIDPHDEHLPALRYEPRAALVASEHGFSDLHHIIQGAKSHLQSRGCLLFEHGCAQQEKLAQMLSQAFFSNIHPLSDLAGQPRALLGWWR